MKVFLTLTSAGLSTVLPALCTARHQCLHPCIGHLLQTLVDSSGLFGSDCHSSLLQPSSLQTLAEFVVIITAARCEIVIERIGPGNGLSYHQPHARCHSWQLHLSRDWRPVGA